MSYRQMQQTVTPVINTPRGVKLTRLEKRLLTISTSEISQGLNEIRSLLSDDAEGKLTDHEYVKRLFAARYDLNRTLETIEDLIDSEREGDNAA